MDLDRIRPTDDDTKRLRCGYHRQLAMNMTSLLPHKIFSKVPLHSTLQLNKFSILNGELYEK